MGNWKLLGEVPDSDDEALDDYSRESQEESQPRNNSVADLPSHDDLGGPADDIWDVPASLPQENETPKPARLLSSPDRRRISSATPTTPRQTLPIDTESDDEIDLVREDPPGLSDLESSPFPSLTTAHHQKDNVAPTNAPDIVQQPPSSPLSSLGSVSDISPSPPPPPPPPPPPRAWTPPAEPPRHDRSPSPFPVLPDSPSEFRLGFIRSLRPRKPIQQHPYLLENARYTRVMKSHGVKPVRVPYISEHDKAVTGEDSQEQEFAEDSQGANQRDSTQQEDTQGALPSSSLGPAGDVLRTPSPITSTPARRLLFPSSGGSGAARTDNTSLSDEDDFPSLDSFIRRRQQHGAAAGHQDTTEEATRRKRAKTGEPTFREQTPSAKWIPVHIDLTPTPPRLHPTSDPGHMHMHSYDPPDSPREEVPEGENESDSDVVPRSGRRIPASWLILDRRVAPSHAERAVPRRAATQADPVPRKGLALPKRGGTGAAAALDFMFDESDDDDSDVEVVGSRARTTGTEATPEEEDDGAPYQYTHESYDMDDTQSVVEEDIIDRMTIGTKRGPSRKESAAKRRRTNNPFKGIPGQKTKQPKITKMLGRSQVAAQPDRHMQRTHSAPQRRHHLSKHTRPAARKRQTPLSLPPPMLSILDFVEPQAPDFIRIAARTARSRTRLGRASPSRKIINLGSRADNIDALSVLHNWKAGKIQPRVPASQKPVRRVAKQQQSVLRDLSPNLARHTSATSKESPRVEPPKRTIHLKSVGQRVRAREASVRPAQLETTTPGGRLKKTYFVSRKKELDEMYRKRRRETSVLPNVHLERFIDDNASMISTANSGFPVEEATPVPERSARDEDKHRSRFRKRYDPQRIDTTAPRFVHALDPLPMELGTVSESEELPVDAPERKANKLLGLGPFGSQYSQHFDIFPLDGSVFFHQSTLLGSGRLSKALGTGTGENHAQAALTETPLFQLDRRDLAWDAWDDNVSSEFGILLDWLADILLPSNGSLGIHTGRKVTEAVNFVLDFIPRCIAAPGVSEEVQQSFVMRCLDVLASFAGRLEATTGQQAMQAADPITKNNLAALSGMLLVAVWMLRICRDAPSCLGESFQTEELLKRLAKLTMRILQKCGLQCVRTAYTDLQQSTSCAHGIRDNQQVLVSWTILIQVLGYARLPRAGFWDLAYAVVLLDGFSMNTCTDAGVMERLWEDMFTLLPLGEVDSAGAVQPGLRQLVPLDGWALPRQAVSRVFALYKANARQAPSFNAYCRAMVGRCHYLVAEWGWQQCSAMVGVIFDFYGEHDFAHLRNEEAHASPAFLEALGRPPLSLPASVEAASSCLAIDPEDKCFHIFIKMLGLVLLRLRRLGLTNELRNLLARTLPNHNRQLLKESDVHPRDLAALRNHHDLLCTLFWASPPALRRGVHLIEKLVTPGSAHKEACLINIRAWNQLARFVVAAGEDYGVYKSFATWMNGIFQQVLEQHQSVETELQRQFQQLSASMMRGISPHALRAMAAKNQAAATDVLHACVAASLDVLQHAPSLTVATYCFSGMQLEAIFKMTPTPDWTLLQVSLDAVQHYLDRLQKAMDEQYSSTLDELANPVDAHDTEEAVLMLDHRLAKSFFQCTRALITMPPPDTLRPGARAACTERAVLLAGRLACRFVHAGVYRLSVFFGSGDYALFERRPAVAAAVAAAQPLALQRKYLPLFVSAVLENNVFDFQDVGASLLELWLLSLVSPATLLGYETRLAATLKRHDLPYVRGATLTSSPSYDTNRALFACVLSSMRRSLREAEAGRRQQQLRGDFARALKRVMQQMKEDLRSSAHDDTHERYMAFVRGLVALIKSHGGDICPLDAFFYQQSTDYTPSLDDPQLQTAGIVAYGLRLGEGEATAAPQLFHYLHNNFHIALANNQLPQTCGILTRSLDASDEVLRFVLERMLPAVLRATRATPDAWPMLAVYCGALQAFLTRGAVARDVCGHGAEEENDMAAAVAGLVAEVLGWLRATHDSLAGGNTLSCAQVHVMAQLAALVGALQPLVTACFCLAGVATGTRQMLERVIGGFQGFAARAMEVLKGREGGVAGLLGYGEDSVLLGVASWEEEETGQGQVDMFSKMIARHVRENWVVGAGQIAVRRAGSRGGPGTTGGTGPGTAYGPWKMEELLEEVEREMSCWRLVVPERSRVRRRWPR